MKTRLKKATSLFLALCMALTLLPGTVLAAESTLPTELKAITATAKNTSYPEGETALGNITLTTANMFPDIYNNRRIYVEISGLLPSTAYYYNVKVNGTETTENSSHSSDANGRITMSLSFNNSNKFKPALDEEFTVTFTLYKGSKWDSFTGSYLHDYSFEPITFTTCFLSEMPELTLAELNTNQENLVSTADLSPYANAWLPYEDYATLETASSAGTLWAELVGEDGTADAKTYDSNAPYVNETTSQYPGYDDIFQGYVSLYHRVISFGSGSLYVGKQLTAGRYDLKIYDGKTLLYTLEDIVKAVDEPLVTYMNIYSGSYLYTNSLGSTTAYAEIDLTNGDPNDFSVEFYHEDGTLLGTSTGYDVSNAYYPNMVLYYEIPLSSPLAESTKYEARIVCKSGAAFAGKTSATATYYESGDANLLRANFGSRYYANIVAVTEGYKEGDSYKATLSRDWNSTPLAETIVTPDANGLFDFEFTDENGDVLALEPYTDYTLMLYKWDTYQNTWDTNYSSGTWVFNRGIDYVYGAEEASLAAAEGTIPVSIFMDGSYKTAGFSFYGDNARAYFRTKADCPNAASLSNIGSFTLRLTSVLGDVYTITPDTATSSIELYTYENSKYYGTRYFDLNFPAVGKIPQGYYTGELLYNGQLLVDSADNVNIMEDDYPRDFDQAPYVYMEDECSYLGLRYASSVYGYGGLTDDPLEIYLYTMDNRTVTPNHILTIDPPGERDTVHFTKEQLAVLNPYEQYRAAIYQNDIPIYAYEDEYGYYAVSDNIRIQPNKLNTYSVTAQSAENGTLTILPVTGYTDDTNAIPAYSDVYVQAKPAEGYRLKPGSVKVNGKSILGRGFPVTENAVVTAEFEKIPAKKYDININQWINNGTATANKTQAIVGETIIVTLTPNEGYMVNGASYSSPYAAPSTSGLSNIHMTKVNDTVWVFTMPASDVTIYANFRQPGTVNINAYASPSSGGTVSASTASAPESTDVIITAAPADGYEMTALTASYSSTTVDLLKHPGTEPNTYILSVPSQDITSYISVRGYFSKIQQNSISCSYVSNGTISADVSKAYSGDTVTLTVTPDEGYRLAHGSLKVIYSGPNSAVYPTQNADGTWSFTMLGGYAYVSCVFEELPPVQSASLSSSGALSITLDDLTEDTVLATALYDADGRMIGVDYVTVKAGSTSYNTAVDLSGTPADALIFLLDPDSHASMTSPVDVTLG